MEMVDTELPSDKVITPLRLLQGGKQPPKRGDNWLGRLNEWTVFTAKCIALSKVDLFLFQVREKYANGTCLILFLPKEEPMVKYVSTEDFSNEYVLFDILEDGNGTGDRTDLDRRLEVDANTEQDNTVA